MRAQDLKAILAGGSPEFRRLNAGLADTVGAGQPQRRVADALVKAPAYPVLGDGHCVRAVGIRFHATHGKRLDCGGNLAAVDKPILDALVNLRLALDDAKIKTRVTQR